MEGVIADREREAQETKRQTQVEIAELRAKDQELHDLKSRQEQTQLNRLFDDEKQELHTEMKVLKQNAEEFEKMRDNFETRFAL